MITAKALAEQANKKGLDLHQNLTVGTKKIYCVTLKGSRTALDSGYLLRMAKFVTAYQA